MFAFLTAIISFHYLGVCVFFSSTMFQNRDRNETFPFVEADCVIIDEKDFKKMHRQRHSEGKLCMYSTCVRIKINFCKQNNFVIYSKCRSITSHSLVAPWPKSKVFLTSIYLSKVILVESCFLFLRKHAVGMGMESCRRSTASGFFTLTWHLCSPGYRRNASSLSILVKAVLGKKFPVPQVWFFWLLNVFSFRKVTSLPLQKGAKWCWSRL